MMNKKSAVDLYLVRPASFFVAGFTFLYELV